MGNNPYFPEWESANDILNAFVDDNFGLYVSRPTEETAYITFLPEDKLADIVPAQYAPVLNERARVFTNQINKFLNKYKILSEIPDEIPEDEKNALIRTRFDAASSLYKADFSEQIVTRLKRTLGLRTVYDKKIKKLEKMTEPKLPPHLACEGKFKALCKNWNINGAVIRAIFNAFKGSFDIANDYLEFMDSEDYLDPKWAWEPWKLENEMIADGYDSNPFENRDYTLGFSYKKDRAIQLAEEAQSMYDVLMLETDPTKKLRKGVDVVLDMKKLRAELHALRKSVKRDRDLKEYIEALEEQLNGYLMRVYNEACGIDV